jgi:multicomponent Na+:H+ antiporter subunit E
MANGRSRNLRRLTVFLILFAFWLIFSGHFDPLHISLGLICTSLVALFSYDLLLPDVTFPTKLLSTWRFLGYVPWLISRIVVANLHVVYLVLRPGEIRPRLVRFKTSLTGDLSRVTLGNSITLTPGTLTMDIDGGEFYVHALSDKAAADVVTGEVERRVAHVFLEPTAPQRPAPGPEQ